MERCEHYKNSLEAVQDAKRVKQEDREEKLIKRFSKDWIQKVAVVIGVMLLVATVTLTMYTIISIDADTYGNPMWHLLCGLSLIVFCIILLSYSVWLKYNVMYFNSNKISFMFASSIVGMIAPTLAATAAIVRMF